MDKLRDNKGSTLAITMLTILVLTILGQAIMLSSAAENRATQAYFGSTEAFWLADAGIHKALWEFTQNSCHGFVQEGTTTYCASCSSCGSGNKTLAATLNTGDYDIVLNKDNTNAKSTGCWPSRTSPKRVRQIVQLDSGSLFKYGAFASDNITIGNNAIITGNVGTNSTAAGTIDINNGVQITGDVSTGPGGTVNNGGTITGSTTNTNNVLLPPVIVPASLTSCSSEGTITNSTTISGSHKYTAINLSNNKTLTFSGTANIYLTSTTNAFTTGNNFQVVLNPGANVNIYSDGKITLSNNGDTNKYSTAPNPGDPSKLTIYSTYSGANGVQITNNGVFYGAIYAPTTDATINNNGGFYGSVVGKTLSLSNNIHLNYNQVLGGNITSATRKWQEL